MNHQRTLGLQWKLAAIFLLASLLSSGMVAVGYFGGIFFGAADSEALSVGIGLGLVTVLAGSIMAVRFARSIKLRLWEAGDMAERIARGDFSARLAAEEHDEIGLLAEQLNSMAGHLQTAMTELRRLAEQNRQLAEEAGRGAALEERAKLARDLHDTVNQQLFVLAMRTAAVRRKLEQAGAEAAAQAPELAALEELAREAHGEARKLILQLRPTTLEQQGLGPAMAEYTRAAAAKEGWESFVEIEPAVRITGSMAEALFRVAQEALNNVSKHAEAATVWVRLQRTQSTLQMEIADDGAGFDMRVGVRPTAVGLIGMQERVAAMGGKLKVRSSPGEGTSITVTLPLPREEGPKHDSIDAG